MTFDLEEFIRVLKEDLRQQRLDSIFNYKKFSMPQRGTMTPEQLARDLDTICESILCMS